MEAGVETAGGGAGAGLDGSHRDGWGVGRRGWRWWTAGTADAGVGIETAGGACGWGTAGTAGTAGTGVALRWLGLGLGWNGLWLGLVLR